MITIEQQQRLLIAISEKLPRKIIAYAIGGTAMMLSGLKLQTKDIDLVFAEESDRMLFLDAAKSIGYKETSPFIIYGRKPNTPIMIAVGDDRIDLFSLEIITAKFSKNMMNRAKETHQYGQNLVIKAADPMDIIIMKSATSRSTDIDDIISILKNGKVNWNILIDEAGEQIRLGNELAVLSLGEKLEKLSNQKAVEIPKKVLDGLWKMLKGQMNKKRKK